MDCFLVERWRDFHTLSQQFNVILGSNFLLDNTDAIELAWLKSSKNNLKNINDIGQANNNISRTIGDSEAMPYIPPSTDVEMFRIDGDKIDLAPNGQEDSELNHTILQDTLTHLKSKLTATMPLFAGSNASPEIYDTLIEYENAVSETYNDICFVSLFVFGSTLTNRLHMRQQTQKDDFGVLPKLSLDQEASLSDFLTLNKVFVKHSRIGKSLYDAVEESKKNDDNGILKSEASLGLTKRLEGFEEHMSDKLHQIITHINALPQSGKDGVFPATDRITTGLITIISSVAIISVNGIYTETLSAIITSSEIGTATIQYSTELVNSAATFVTQNSAALFALSSSNNEKFGWLDPFLRWFRANSKL